MLQGVTFADYNDLESVKAAVTENTYAIIVEAVQGEGGIYPANAEFLQGIRKLCDENDIIMICDEIQCGMGRSGKMFAYQKYDIVPDIVTMAKGIGNGITVGAIAAKEEVGKMPRAGRPWHDHLAEIHLPAQRWQRHWKFLKREKFRTM